MLPDAAILPVITNLLARYQVELKVVLVVFARNAIQSPTLARVTVVVPTVKSFQVEPSVVYSSETDGTETPPFLYIFMVEFASSAVKVNPNGPG